MHSHSSFPIVVAFLALLIPCSHAATIDGFLTDIDRKANTLTIEAGPGPTVLRIRGDVTLDGQRMSLEKLEPGMLVTVTSNEPGVANHINARTLTPVGVWKWFNGITVTIRNDGTFTDNKSNRGIWMWTDKGSRKFTMKWGKSVDDLTLGPKGQRLEGISVGTNVTVTGARLK